MQIILEVKKVSEKAISGSKPKDDTGPTEQKYDARDLGTANIKSHTEHSNRGPVAAGSRHRHVYQQEFLKLAKKLFKFFLPLESSPALVAKYWGAVYASLEVNTFSPVLILMSF